LAPPKGNTPRLVSKLNPDYALELCDEP